MAEENLVSHVSFHGSLFSVIRQMDLPGIDMLNSDPQDMLNGESFMAAKQVSSVAHLIGAGQVHSESSDWVQGNQGRHATLEERRGQGNLQYVLGINQITSYFGWDKIGEEGCRAYHDYMGRLAMPLTGGTHVCDVAVLYPIRSAWAHFVPSSKPLRWGDESSQSPKWVERIARGYPDLVRALLKQQVDLDIIDEEAIISGQVRDGALCVADERYRAIVLPPLFALGLETLRALARFARAGGVLLSAGPLPVLADSAEGTPVLRQELDKLFGPNGPARLVPLEELPSVLRSRIKADLLLDSPNADVLYTHRRLEGRDLYFVINNSSLAMTIRPTLRMPGPYTLYRPLTGKVESVGQSLVLEMAGYEGIFVVCESAL